MNLPLLMAVTPDHLYIIAETLVFVYIFWKNQYLSYRLKYIKESRYSCCSADVRE